MKTISGILMVLALTTALGQDTKMDPPAGAKSTKIETVRRGAMSASTRERLAKMIIQQKAPDKVVGKRFVFRGPVVALFKSDDPLQKFNPFSASNSGAKYDSEHLRPGPYLPPPRGFVLFRLEF